MMNKIVKRVVNKRRGKEGGKKVEREREKATHKIRRKETQAQKR